MRANRTGGDAMYGVVLEHLNARPLGSTYVARCPFPERHRHGDRNPSVRLKVGRAGQLVGRCFGCGADLKSLMHRAGCAGLAWRPDWREGRMDAAKVPWKTVAIHEYRHADGTLYAEKLRQQAEGHGKRFQWRRPLPAACRQAVNVRPDAPAWCYGLEEGDYAPRPGDKLTWAKAQPGRGPVVRLPLVPVGLYGLERLADAADAVAIAEGERKADLLTDLGLPCLAPPNGAKSFDWRWGEHFAGKKLIVFPDYDTPGLSLATQVAGAALLWGCAGVKVLEPGSDRWPLAEGMDIADWLDALPADRAGRRYHLFGLLRQFGSFVSQPAPVEAS